MKQEIKNDWIKLELGGLIEVSKEKFDPLENKWTQCVELEHISQGTGLLFGTVNSNEQKSIKNKFKKGDVLFGKLRPYLKKYWKAKFDGVCSTEIWVLRGRKISNDYLYCLIQTQKFNKISNVSSGSKMPRADWNYMKEIPFEVPKLNSEQQKIAEILSTWDKAIELKEKLIEEKNEFKRGLMQKLLTGEMRFPEFTGEWEQKKLGDIFSERKETNQNGSELLSITSSRGVIKRSEIERKDNSNEDKSKYKKICCGDIGYNTMRMWQGVSAVSEYEGIVSPAYTVIKLKQDGDIYYFGYLFKLRKMINLLWRHSQGLVNDTLNLKYENFKIIKVTVPTSKVEQEKISSTLKSIDKEISLIKAEKELLGKQKRGLMQLLLTGIVRVEVD